MTACSYVDNLFTASQSLGGAIRMQEALADRLNFVRCITVGLGADDVAGTRQLADALTKED